MCTEPIRAVASVLSVYERIDALLFLCDKLVDLNSWYSWWHMTAPLLLSDDEDRRAYDMYVIGTQESGGTIRRGLLPGRGEQQHQSTFTTVW
jgi:hypothetical protein